MLFGKKEEFAIECELEKKPTEFFNCYVCLWTNGMQIGNYKRGGTLKVLRRFYEDSLSNSNRYNKELSNASAASVFNTIWYNLYNINDICRTLEEINENWFNYHQFDICTNAAPAFDGWKIFLVDCDKNQRFIWKNIEQDFICEIRLPLNTYAAIISTFLEWSENILEGK